MNEITRWTREEFEQVVKDLVEAGHRAQWARKPRIVGFPAELIDAAKTYPEMFTSAERRYLSGLAEEREWSSQR